MQLNSQTQPCTGAFDPMSAAVLARKGSPWTLATLSTHHSVLTYTGLVTDLEKEGNFR